MILTIDPNFLGHPSSSSWPQHHHWSSSHRKTVCSPIAKTLPPTKKQRRKFQQPHTVFKTCQNDIEHPFTIICFNIWNWTLLFKIKPLEFCLIDLWTPKTPWTNEGLKPFLWVKQPWVPMVHSYIHPRSLTATAPEKWWLELFRSFA